MAANTVRPTGRTSRAAWLWIAATVVLLTTALWGEAIWSRLSLRMALTRAGFSPSFGGWQTKATDPWGRTLQGPAWDRPDPHRGPREGYSVGPNGVDEVGGGDDVLLYPERYPAVVVHENLRGIALWLIGMLLPLALLTRIKVPERLAHEALRSGLIALVPWLQGILGVFRVFSFGERAMLLEAAGLANRERPMVIPWQLALVGTWWLLCWFMVLAGRQLRVAEVRDREEVAGPPPG